MYSKTYSKKFESNKLFAPHFSRSFSKRKLGGLDEKVDESQVRFYLEGLCYKTKAQTQRIQR
jgi:hypothetical protein